MRKIGIIGFGWLGSRIAQDIKENFEIFTTTRSQENLQQIEGGGFHAELAVFDDAEKDSPGRWSIAPELDAIIITVPFSERRASRQSLQLKLSKLFSFIENYKKQIFFTSSTSIYPDEPRTFTEEMVLPQNVFIENLLRKAFPQINILRLGGLMGDSRLLKNFNISDLDAVVNHIHFKDISTIIQLMIEREVHSKIYNVVAPLHPAKREVIAAQNNISLKGIQYDKKQRIISSEKLISELDFTFEHPDPKYFHL
ncbi:hypothetical protein [Chryseobacterium taichungense]|uniref:hypothetical protein n=1 Tax=Chryseobacterium taichungense TaxID=295069 RepID=UPI0028B1DEB6|nr:hypothetical protein [Chryseobacterium taichungense]